jgi:heme/copper-type cytochrome/quinol oxidase subunit 3
MDAGPIPVSGASAPHGPHLEPEPLSWQPRASWVTARLLSGAAAFFFASFVFAYFYLKSLDVNKSWKLGAVNPSLGLGIAIVLALVLSAVCMQAATRPGRRQTALIVAALVLALLSVILQVVQWTTLGFGPASGGYASVFIGWTGTMVVFTLLCAYWIETQAATVWRATREGPGPAGPEVVAANLASCAFFWTFYVAFGVLAFVILYLL